MNTQQQSTRPRMPSGFPGTTTYTPTQAASNPLYGSSSFSSSLSHQASTDSQLPEQTKLSDPNIARYCRIGQELVHEIIQKSTEIFQVLKATQLPNHLQTNTNVYNDRKKRAAESLRTISEYFKQLKTAYNTIDSYCSQINLKPPKELIPFIEEEETKITKSESMETEWGVYQAVQAEHQALDEQLRMKNMHLKEIIDQLRNILWEINTNLSIKNSTSMTGSV